MLAGFFVLLASMVLASLLVIVYYHFQVLARGKFYQNQNVTIAPGAYRFLIGNLLELGNLAKVGKKK